MLRASRFILCIFLTSSFNSAWADFCFDNTNTSGIMAKQICFKQVQVLNWGTPNHKVYIRNSDVDEAFPIQAVVATAKGFLVTIKGDYINYSEDCGLTIFSQFDFHIPLNAKYEYQHNKTAALEIKYVYTPNNCKVKAKLGAETFVPKNPIN